MPEKLDNCPLCGAGELRKDDFATQMLNLSSEHAVYQCQSCSFRFLNPRPTQKEYMEAYITGEGPLVELYPLQKGFYAQADTHRITEYRNKLDLLVKMGAGKRLLEIGSCTGVFLNEARHKGFEVEGIEPSEENCQKAKRQFALDLRYGTVEDQDFQPGSFDVIFGSHVFEHFLDPVGVAKLLHRWLKVRGVLMIEVPNQFDITPVMRLRWKGKPDSIERSFMSIHHSMFFSRKTLRLLGKLSGYRVCRVRNVWRDSLNPLKRPIKGLRRMIRVIIGGSHLIELLAQKR